MSNQRRKWCAVVDTSALKVTDRTQERTATGSGDGPMIQRVGKHDVKGRRRLPHGGEHQWSYSFDRTGPAPTVHGASTSKASAEAATLT